MTQDAMALAMAFAGYPMHQTTVAKIENGGRPTSVGELAALAMIFEVPMAALLTISDASRDYAILAELAAKIAEYESELATLTQRQTLLVNQISTSRTVYDDVKRQLDARHGFFNAERIAFEHPNGEDN
jgi:hypothetical protein